MVGIVEIKIYLNGQCLNNLLIIFFWIKNVFYSSEIFIEVLTQNLNDFY